MIRNLKRKLYFLFVSSIMFVFTIVFFLLASENIETMQNVELNFVNRQATNLVLLFESSTNYAENLEICEKKYGYAFRLFTGHDELLYESTNIKDIAETIELFFKSLKSSESIHSNESSYSTQSGTHTFRYGNGKTYYGILCSIYTNDGYLYLAIIKEKSGIAAFSSTIVHYLLIWFIVLVAVLLVSSKPVPLAAFLTFSRTTEPSRPALAAI